MFRHCGAIIREVFRTKQYKANTLICVLHQPYWNDYNIIILKYTKLISVTLQCCDVKVSRYRCKFVAVVTAPSAPDLCGSRDIETRVCTRTAHGIHTATDLHL